jgi:hypothetical protein
MPGTKPLQFGVWRTSATTGLREYYTGLPCVGQTWSADRSKAHAYPTWQGACRYAAALGLHLSNVELLSTPARRITVQIDVIDTRDDPAANEAPGGGFTVTNVIVDGKPVQRMQTYLDAACGWHIVEDEHNNFDLLLELNQY